MGDGSQTLSDGTHAQLVWHKTGDVWPATRCGRVVGLGLSGLAKLALEARAFGEQPREAHGAAA